MKKKVWLILLSVLTIGIITAMIILSRTEYRNTLFETSKTETKESSNTISWDISASSSDHVTATFDIDAAELTISGSGYMKNWTSGSEVPWYTYVQKTSSGHETISELTIGSGVKNIGDYAFFANDQNYMRIRNLIIPNTIISIGKYSFYGWSGGLDTDLTIPSSVTTIGDYAFGELSWALNATAPTRYINIPSSVNSIGVGAFAQVYYTLGDVNVIINSANSNYSTDGKVIFNKQKTELVQYVGNFYNYTIPSTVTIIKEKAFYIHNESGSDTYTLTIPSSVTSIEKEAFYFNKKLSNIAIPNSVIYIGKDILRRIKFKFF